MARTSKDQPRYVVGIDLGTTNTVLAAADTSVPGEPDLRLVPLEQLVAAGEVAPRAMLPSVRYHAAAGELAPAQVGLPWRERTPAAPDRSNAPVVVGAFAQDLGARVPGRLVTSAKSWLCHPDVDREAPVLPWGAPEDVPRVSPVEASASYLAHVRAAWDHAHPGHPLAAQDVVLTVPASFDDDARRLTVRAAELAGLPKVRLIEEPQAAVYDWLWRHRSNASAMLGRVKLILVCDVGGGTSDFSLVRAELRESGPRLTRTAVGDHLMLGGDNMDLALARAVEARWGGAPLGATQLSALVQQCRVAKERLLGDDPPERTSVAVLGGGSRLVGGARSAELLREDVQRAVLDGFFPQSAPGDEPAKRAAAIREFGLPFVADPAVTRHVAHFLKRHAEIAREALGIDAAPGPNAPFPVPDAILPNGGVFRSAAIRARLLDVLAAWRGGTAPLELDNAEPDLAVARGAAAYGLARRGVGLRIGGGTARAYFLRVEGKKAGSREAVCLVPRGTEEGEEVVLPRPFALRLGRPVQFDVLSSTTSRYHRAGEAVPEDDAAAAVESFQELPSVVAVLERSGKRTSEPDDDPAPDAKQQTSVRVSGQLTEVGTLELHCAETEGRRRWALEFQVRGAHHGAGSPGSAGAPAVVTESHPRLREARERIQRVFSRTRGGAEPPREIKGLRRDLESILGARETWPPALLRELFGTLLAGAKRRRRTADHERVWLNLVGWTLRPGTGVPLDEWRVQETWALYGEGVQYSKDAPVWSEWWTLWRRIAGGLDDRAQETLLEAVEPHLRRRDAKRAGRSGLEATADEMVRLAGALERVPAARKTALGNVLVERGADAGAHAFWALGRLGARAPVYGSAHAVVAPSTATAWVRALLALDWKTAEGAAFATVLLARRTGDRERDLTEDVRDAVLARLAAESAPPAWARLVREVAALEEGERRIVFGDALPPGLRVVGD